jgi:predicted nucleic acid-binding protein
VKKYLLDTNVVLRFLLDDHIELSKAAAGALSARSRWQLPSDLH